MTAQTKPQLWAVTELAHGALRDVRDDCEGCLQLASDAAAYARAMGSKTSTYRSGEHAVTVTRALGVVEL